MLVLSRRVGESLQIGDIKVVVVRVQGGKVRLGIEAEEKVKITRTDNRSDDYDEHDDRPYKRGQR